MKLFKACKMYLFMKSSKKNPNFVTRNLFWIMNHPDQECLNKKNITVCRYMPYVKESSRNRILFMRIQKLGHSLVLIMNCLDKESLDQNCNCMWTCKTCLFVKGIIQKWNPFYLRFKILVTKNLIWLMNFPD